VPQLLIELLGEDAVPVMDQETVPMVNRDGFRQLLKGPRSGRMYGHIGMQNPAGRMSHDDKHVEDAKHGRDHDAEITGHNCLAKIADIYPPAL
jgi:hypothetical protein